MWVGNVDALRLVSLRGEEIAPLEPEAFEARVRRVLEALAATGARLVVANVPDPTRLGVLRPAAGAIAACREADGSVTSLPADALVSVALDPALLPVPPCAAVVRRGDRDRIGATIAAWNAAIAAAAREVAAEHGVEVVTVDAWALIERLAAGGIDLDGDGAADLAAGAGGSFFGPDGVHPSRAGSAALARAFLEALSAAGKPARRLESVPAARRGAVPAVGALAGDDPLFPQRLLRRLARRVARTAPDDGNDPAAFTPAVVGSPSSYFMFSGLETGSIAEADVNLSCAVVTTPTCSGVRACQMGTNTPPSTLVSREMEVPEAYVRAYHLVTVTATPSPTEACAPITGFDTNGVVAVCAADVCVQPNGQVRYRMRDRINNVTIGTPTASLPSGVWRRVEVRTRLRPGINDDECEFRLDGAVVAASRTLNLGTGTLSSAFLTNRQAAYAQPANPGNWIATFDDLAVTEGVWPGPGRIIARQGRTGAPTYDDFSLVGGATIDAVWSDTPVNTTTRAQSPSFATTAAQTMRVAPFDAGITAMGPGSTPAVCQTWINANTATDPDRTYAMRRRINGVNTDVVLPDIETDPVPFSDGLRGGFWVAPLSALDGAEIGAVKTGLGGAQLRVNDAWLTCEYEPPAGEAACAQPAGQPVQCVPSWGTGAVGQLTGFANYADGVSCTTGTAASYTVQSCSIALGNAPNGNIRCAIYDDRPDPNKDALCASAPAPAVANAVNTLPVTGCPTLAPNTRYWIVWNTSSDSVAYRLADSGCSGPNGSSMYFEAPFPTGAWAPDPWGSRQPDTCRLSVYMTLVPGGGPTTTTSTSSTSTSSTSTSSSSTSTSSTSTSSSSTSSSSTTSTSTTSSTSTSSTSSTSTSSTSSTSSSTSSTTSSTSQTTVTTTTVPTTSSSTSSSTTSSTAQPTTTSSTSSSTSSSSSSSASSSTSSSTSTSSTATPTTSTSTTTIGGLVGAWGFNEGQGPTVADLSGSGNAGTISGASWSTAGRFGNALQFDGVNDWVTVADAASLDLTTGLTIEAYVFPTVTPTGWRTLVAKEGTGTVPYFLHANTDSNQPVTGLTIGGNEWMLFGTAALPVNTWTHVAATYDGTTQRLFVNGTQVASRAQTGAAAVTTGPLRIGGNGVYGEFFQGRIDEVRIYNRALSAAEIAADAGRPVP